MKYYHVIYNSSEASMLGGTGFGLRTATEGTPDSLLKAIDALTLFPADDWETYQNTPTPEQIMQNPACMDNIPKDYAVTAISDSQGNIYHLIARRAYVGFDYSFYKTNAPTRPGNFVIDYYIFDKTPDSSAYQILYEKAFPESNHFIPASVRPTDDNEEMRTISIGKQPLLPADDKPFTADVENALDKDVVKLFFHFLAAKQAGKKLYVKADRQKALKITADFYRMLDAKSATEIHTRVNHRAEGPNEFFDIYFILDSYPHQVYPGGFYSYIELDSATMPDTDEAKTFSHELQDFVSASFNENKSDIDDILRWLLMPEYSSVKKLSKVTNDAFFLYCIQPGNFSYNNFKDKQGHLNDEFLNVLMPYTKKEKNNAQLFDSIVKETINDANYADIIQLIREFHKFEALGFDMKENCNAVKQHVSECILTSPDVLRGVLDKIGYDSVVQFFDKDVFERNGDFTLAKVLDSDMLKLYRHLLADAELSDRETMLYDRFLARDMESKYLIPIIDDCYGADNEGKLLFFVHVLKDELKPFDTIWQYMEHYLQFMTCPDFLKLFQHKLDDSKYAPMFYYSIKAHKADFSSIESIQKLTDILHGNEKLKALIQTGYHQDGIYANFKNYVKTLYMQQHDKAREALTAINVNILGFFTAVKDDQLADFALYLDMVANNGYERLHEKKVPVIFSLVSLLDDNETFGMMIPAFVKAYQKGDIPAEELALLYDKFNHNVSTNDMIDDLDAKHSIPMLGIIICKMKKMKFEQAFALAKEIGIDKEMRAKVMEQNYEKDYKSYLRSKKIKGFFKSIFRVFLPKDKDNTDKKNTDKKK